MAIKQYGNWWLKLITHEMLGGLKLSDAFPLKFHMVLDWSILPSLCRTCFGLAMAWAARSHGTSSWASTFVSIWDVIRIIDPQPQPNSTIDPQLIHIESIEMFFFYPQLIHSHNRHNRHNPWHTAHLHIRVESSRQHGHVCCAPEQATSASGRSTMGSTGCNQLALTNIFNIQL
jgi:hypothetical protein